MIRVRHARQLLPRGDEIRSLHATPYATGARRFAFVSISHDAAKVLEGALEGYVGGKRDAEAEVRRAAEGGSGGSAHAVRRRTADGRALALADSLSPKGMGGLSTARWRSLLGPEALREVREEGLSSRR